MCVFYWDTCVFRIEKGNWHTNLFSDLQEDYNGSYCRLMAYTNTDYSDIYENFSARYDSRNSKRRILSYACAE